MESEHRLFPTKPRGNLDIEIASEFFVCPLAACPQPLINLWLAPRRSWRAQCCQVGVGVSRNSQMEPTPSSPSRDGIFMEASCRLTTPSTPASGEAGRSPVR